MPSSPIRNIRIDDDAHYCFLLFLEVRQARCPGPVRGSYCFVDFGLCNTGVNGRIGFAQGVGKAHELIA